MSYDPYQSSPVVSGVSEVDAGLQSYMRSVYNTMTLGLGVTGVVAYAVANVPALYHVIFETPLAFVAMLAPLGFILFGFTPARVARMDSAKLRSLFFVFSAIMGLSMAVLLKTFTGDSVVRVFFITGATFAAMSLWGYTTKRNLSGMGSFLMMGLFGIVIASLVNIFLGSAGVQFVVSILGVAIFTGLTAYETQMLKETYAYGRNSEEANAKMGIMGALNLYLSFINLFQFLLQLMGNRR